MAYYGAKDLADSLRTVRKNTIQIAEEIPEDKYGFSASPETRTVAQLLTHIALGHRFHQLIHSEQRLSSLDGFDFMGVMGPLMAEEQKPRAKVEILNLLKNEGDAWANWIESLSDEFLAERVQMPAGAPGAGSKSRFEMLLSTKEHEMHHRGQLMLIERMLGIVPHLTRAMQERMAQMQQAQAQPAR